MIHYAVQASPFARKVRVVAIEKGVGDPGMAPTAVPFTAEPGLVAANPLAKVPTLVTADGRALFDSRVICEYLDSLSPIPVLIPSDATRWEVLTRAALADGIMDAGVAARGESLRPDGERSEANIAKQTAAILRAVDRLEAEIERFEHVLRIDTIGIACALGYLDFRFAHLSWRDGRPRLAAWHEGIVRRPSLQATRPDA